MCHFNLNELRSQTILKYDNVARVSINFRCSRNRHLVQRLTGQHIHGHLDQADLLQKSKMVTKFLIYHCISQTLAICICSKCIQRNFDLKFRHFSASA